MHNFNYYVRHLSSPGYLLCEVPDAIKQELQTSIDNLEKTPETDARGSLRGHLEEEWHLPITPNMSTFCEHLSGVYLEKFGLQPSMGLAESMRDMTLVEFKLERLWINYQKKYDFNPLHIHSGVFSFVIWVQIPYELEEERKRYKSNGDETAAFMFQYLNSIGGIDTEYLYLDKSFEWKMAFFPARLNHGVNPFYTSDDYRISISGNVYVNDK